MAGLLFRPPLMARDTGNCMTTTPSSRPSSTQIELFPDECKAVLQALRGALTEALGAVGVDPSRPQEVARKLGLHRNLTWKVSKIVTSTDAFAAVPHVPGLSGVEILVKALKAAGVPAPALGRIRSAREDFERLMHRHAGDRATLELVAAGFVPDARRTEALLQARRDAFRGNSAIWSVQARMLMTVNILLPSVEDPSRVDLALINGFIDLRRLKPDVAWPLFRRQIWDAEGTTSAVTGQPIDPSCSADEVPLLRAFCSPELPELIIERSETEILYELPAGPVGRTGELTCVYGSLIRSVGSQYADADETICEIGSNLKMPVELMQKDLLIHESLGWAMNPRADLYSQLEGRPVRGRSRRGSTRLTLEAGVHELGRGLDTMATPHVPRYRELLAYTFEQIGWDASAFRGFRLSLPHPPIPAVAMLSMDLAPRPEGS